MAAQEGLLRIPGTTELVRHEQKGQLGVQSKLAVEENDGDSLIVLLSVEGESIQLDRAIVALALAND